MTTTTTTISPTRYEPPSGGTAFDVGIAPAGLGVAAMVMALRSAARQGQIECGVTEMREAEVDRQAQVEARLEAMRRASEADKEGGFWSDVAGIAKKVALVAAIVVGTVATVYTAGTSGLIAAAAVAALTAAPLVLPELANEVADATNMNGWGKLTLQCVALAVCIVLAFWNPAGAIRGTSDVANGVNQGVSTVQKLADATRQVGQLTQAAAQIQQGHALIRQGLATIEVGEQQATAQHREADGLAAEQRRDEALDRLDEVYREAARSARAVARLAETQNDGAQAALRA